MIAQLLVAEGFTSVEEVGYVPMEELLAIDGFDEEVAGELGTRAREYLDRVNAEMAQQRVDLGVEDALAELQGLSPAMLVALGEAGVKTLDDLGDLASDELIDREEGILRAFQLGEDEANAIIMAARAHWFDDEEAAPEQETSEEAAETVEAEAEPAAG